LLDSDANRTGIISGAQVE